MNQPFQMASYRQRPASDEHDSCVDVVVVGLGYIGLPTAAVLACHGLRTCGVDLSEAVVNSVNAGCVHIEERELDTLVRSSVLSGKLTASTHVPQADYYLIAVPTPLGDNKDPDVSSVEAAAKAIAPSLRPGACVIIESTCPIGTTKRVAGLIAKERPDLRFPEGSSEGRPDISFAYCPERVLPGQIVAELVSNDRVIGGLTSECASRAMRLYERFVKGKCHLTTAQNAEMVKLAENSFRDVNIAFANELSLIAEQLDVDVWEVIRLANRHPRVKILSPGPGVGGHCIAVDPWFLVSAAPEISKLIATARLVNDDKAVHVESRVRAMLEADPSSSIALLGLAFKANIDDFRESPALQIAQNISSIAGDRLLIVEPYCKALPEELSRHGARLVALPEAISGAGSIIILVDHREFQALREEDLRGKIVYDTRGMLT